MIDEQLEHYLRQHLPPVADWAQAMEDQAQKEYIPIMDTVSMNYLAQLITINKPKSILEIGTAIGYSALRMLEAYPATSIVTIEKDEYRFKEAVKYITAQNKQEKIKTIYGDALEEMVTLIEKKETYDFVFIDAAKGSYQEFFELACMLLQNNGLIVSDNILFRGYVANIEQPLPKYKNIVQKIRDYNDWLVTRDDFMTSIIPIGDGIAISYKK